MILGVEVVTILVNMSENEIYTACEDRIDGLQGLRLPSMVKFSAGIASCNNTFIDKCLGPSKILYQKRLEKMWLRAEGHQQLQPASFQLACGAVSGHGGNR